MEETSLPSYGTVPPKLIAGDLALDFINTVEWRGDPEQPQDRLVDYGELVLWSRAAGSLGAADAEALLATAARRPQAAALILANALALRSAAGHLVEGHAPSRADDLDLANRLLSHAPSRRRLADTGDGFAWPLDGEDEAMARPLWPVLWSLGDLLVSDRLGRVRRCADRRCGWLFLDTSRNRSRRWCSMADCGNRAKARRNYARRRAAAPASGPSS